MPVTRLEAIVDQSPDAENARLLIEKYEAYAENFPADDDTNSRYLYRAAALAFRMNKFSQAIELLNRTIRNDYEGGNTVNNALLLGVIHEEKLRNETLSTTVYQAADRAFPGTASIQEKLRGEWPDIDSRLRQLQLQVFDASSNRIDFRKANDFINSSTVYAMLLPGREASANWLFEAAETARSIRAFSKAIELYSWIADYFPESERAPQALFLMAFTLDSDLSRYEEAGDLYEAFLEKYPSNKFSEGVGVLWDNLGRGEEEIMRRFGEKNQGVQE